MRWIRRTKPSNSFSNLTFAKLGSPGNLGSESTPFVECGEKVKSKEGEPEEGASLARFWRMAAAAVSVSSAQAILPCKTRLKTRHVRSKEIARKKKKVGFRRVEGVDDADDEWSV